MNGSAEKYSRLECERRFLVSPASDWRNFVEPYSKLYEDKYLQNTRCRLRVLSDSDSDRRVFKLTKKYGSDSFYSQFISSLILSPEEYEAFDALEGNCLRKRRHYHNYRAQIFSIDVFEDELDGLILCEFEADSVDDLMSADIPAYASPEVTEDEFFQGGNLSRTTQAQLINKLSTF
jgi:CYTH domain-containing protein